MAKTMVQKISDAITGNGKLELAALRVENDSEVRAARQAEDESVNRAHSAENETASHEAAERSADSAYDAASAGTDEAATASARKAWINAQEAVRGHARTVKALRAAAVEARHRREQTELEAEVRCAERIREAIRENVGKTRKLVEGDAGMIALAEERERLLIEADRLSPWGSPQARRIGWIGGMGEGGRSLLGGRGAAHLGAHALNSVFLDSRGCSWDSFVGLARDLGLVEE